MTRTCLAAIISSIVVLAADNAYSQIPAAGPGGELADVPFEVTSVRENYLSRREAVRAFYTMHPSGHFEATWAALRPLISIAYGVRASQIVDAPEWMESARFDIVAKAPEGFDPGDTRAMIRRLLEDRFGLVVRREKRPMPVYSLEWTDRRRRLGSGIRLASPVCDDVAGPDCRAVWGTGIGHIFVRRGPMARFVTWLESETDRPVVDNTGLSGIYDVDLKWPPEPLEATDGVLARGTGPSVYTAVREQLGLKLEPTTADIEVLAIEELRRPTPN